MHFPYFIYGSMQLYVGVDYWTLGVDADYGWLLLDDTYVPAVTDGAVNQVSAFELTDASYARQDVTTRGASTEANAAGEVTSYLTADNPDFGLLAGGEDAGWLVLFRNTGVDATSRLLAAYKISRTTDGSAFAILFIDPVLIFATGGASGRLAG